MLINVPIFFTSLAVGLFIVNYIAIRIFLRNQPKIVYMNAAQIQVIMRGLGTGCDGGEVWDKLSECGDLQGGGIVQMPDGEVVIQAIYRENSMAGTPPNQLQGFRVISEERPVAYLC